MSWVSTHEKNSKESKHSSMLNAKSNCILLLYACIFMATNFLSPAEEVNLKCYSLPQNSLLMVPVEFSIREWSLSNIVGLWTFYVKSFSNISQHGLDIVDWRKPFFVLFNKKRPCPLGVYLYKSSRVNHRVSFIYGVMHTIKHGVCMYFLNTEKRFSWKRFCFRFCRALWYFNRGIE